MSVYKPKTSPYYQYDFVYKGRRYNGSTGATTEAAARKVEQRFRVEAALGKLHNRTVPTLDEAAGEWFAEKGQSLRSADDLLTRLELCVRLIGKNKPVNEVTTADIAAAIKARRAMPRKKPLAPATINRDIIDTIRPVLKRQRQLLNDGGGELVPFPEIAWGELRLPEPEPQARDFTPAQMGDLYDSLQEHWRDFARFQARYGLRLGEMFFKVANVDLEGRRVTVSAKRKNGRPHTIPLLPEDAAMLAARIGRARAAGIDSPWFREMKGGRLKPLAYWGAQKALGKAMRTSGLHEATGARGSHDLRHNAGMQMLRATGNLRTTQKLLGHASIQSTLVYAHALEEDVRSGLDALTRLVPEPTTSGERKPLQNKALKGTV